MEWLSGLIGAGSKLLGGILGDQSAEKNAERNIAMQRQFAQNAISWKVEDAKRAGVHPLFALGASTQGFNNVVGGSGVGDSLSDAGQDISRAVHATGDREARALNLKSAQLDVERKGLENDVLRAELGSRLAKISQPGTPPAIPLPVAAPPGAKIDIEKAKNQLRLFGKTLQNDPYTSDASEAEDVLGEGVADWIWPFAKIPSLAWHNRGPYEKFNKRNSRFFRTGN